MKVTPETAKKFLVVHLPDTRGVTISPYGCGNLKIGPGVYTYSRLPGIPNHGGTCLGSSTWCEEICYAKRVGGVVMDMWTHNSQTESVPDLPEDCKLIRLHISGDFTTIKYVHNWFFTLRDRPDVTMWAYTRSWRLPGLCKALENLKLLPNVQLFASMDESIERMPPKGWRTAWIAEDPRLLSHPYSARHTLVDRELGGGISFLCPETTGHKNNCVECRYCFDGKRGDVTFPQH